MFNVGDFRFEIKLSRWLHHFPFPHHEGCRHRAGKTRRWRMPAYAQQAVRTYTYRVGVAASPFMHRRQYRICDADIIKQRLATRRIMGQRSEEHTSELQSLMRISYYVFCLKKKKS